MPTKAAITPSTPAPRPSFVASLGRDPTATMLGALIVLAVVFFSALAPSRFVSLETLAPWPSRCLSSAFWLWP
jgi:hypothetical protein